MEEMRKENKIKEKKKLKEAREERITTLKQGFSL
jgi:hypothetical protein